MIADRLSGRTGLWVGVSRSLEIDLSRSFQVDRDAARFLTVGRRPIDPRHQLIGRASENVLANRAPLNDPRFHRALLPVLGRFPLDHNRSGSVRQRHLNVDGQRERRTEQAEHEPRDEARRPIPRGQTWSSIETVDQIISDTRSGVQGSASLPITSPALPQQMKRPTTEQTTTCTHLGRGGIIGASQV